MSRINLSPEPEARDDEGRTAAPKGDGDAVNATWHKANRMPPRATLDERVAWHLAHLKACACRTDLPATIVAELKRRGIKPPEPKKGA